MPFESGQMKRLLAAFVEAQPLLWLGVLGLALSVACTAIAVGGGMVIPPEGDLTKAITFDGAVGAYLLTIGLFVPLAHFSRAGKRWWLSWTAGLALYAYGIETIQTLRGLDPRFSRAGGPLDQLAGLLFFQAALGLITTFGILGVKLWVRKAAGAERLMLLAIRYASLATAIAFAAGLWMSAIHGRRTGVGGNILPLHAIGFHGLQGIPVVAWLLSRSRATYDESRRWVHVAGVAWLAACLAIAWQTVAGRPVRELSPATMLACALMVTWGVIAARAGQTYRRNVSALLTGSERRN
jgi:hypothetical protein